MQYRSFPIHLEIESTNRCNLSCVMCPHRIMTRKQEDMSMETFNKIIDQCKNYEVRSSYIHMIGEPILNSNIVEMINKLDSCGIHTSISTNGMLLSALKIKQLLTSSLRELVLCLDGLDQETYNKYRIGGNFSLVKRNIDNCILFKKLYLNEVKADLVVQIIRMTENKHQFKIFKEYYEKKLKGIGRVWIKEFSRFAGYVPEVSDVPVAPRRFKCSKLRTHLAIQSNGDFVICCRDFDGITKIGNIYEMTIYDAWHSVQYNSYRTEFDFKNWKNPLCADC